MPPIGTGGDGDLRSFDPARELDQAWSDRSDQLLRHFDDFDPDALLVELFPFGRRKFASEFLALLGRARLGRKRLIVSSVRDLLVEGHPEKQHHDDEAAVRLDAYFDAVIVHGDPRFARLEETFRPAIFPRTPIYYSGFAARATSSVEVVQRQHQVLVSAGGGLIGGRLLATAVQAHRLVLGPAGLTTRIITGPFLENDAYSALTESAAGTNGLSVERFVPELASAIAASAVSVSQCGYNTSIDILRAGAPAVVVPYDEGNETEQWSRACRLEALGAVKVVPAARLSARTLAQSVLDAMGTKPVRVGLDLGGAAKTADLVIALLRGLGAPRPGEYHDNIALSASAH